MNIENYEVFDTENGLSEILQFLFKLNKGERNLEIDENKINEQIQKKNNGYKEIEDDDELETKCNDDIQIIKKNKINLFLNNEESDLYLKLNENRVGILDENKTILINPTNNSKKSIFYLIKNNSDITKEIIGISLYVKPYKTLNSFKKLKNQIKLKKGYFYLKNKGNKKILEESRNIFKGKYKDFIYQIVLTNNQKYRYKSKEFFLRQNFSNIKSLKYT